MLTAAKEEKVSTFVYAASSQLMVITLHYLKTKKTSENRFLHMLLLNMLTNYTRMYSTKLTA